MIDLLRVRLGWIIIFLKYKSFDDYESLDRVERVLKRFESIILNDINFDYKNKYLHHIEMTILKLQIRRAEIRVIMAKRERKEAREEQMKDDAKARKELKKMGFTNSEIDELLKGI